MAKIGIDVDGVLARFDLAYAELVRQDTGLTFPIHDPAWPATWHWDRERFKSEGMSEADAKATEDRIWDRITRQGSPFWAVLEAYPGAADALYRLTGLRRYAHDIYFITARPGHFAKWLTEMWLLVNGAEAPTVLIAKKKGLIAEALELDIFVDDKPENITDVLMARPEVRAYLIDRPYNRWAVDAKVYGQRSAHLNDVLDIEFGTEQQKAA